jgi:hypothetical protein
MDPLPTVNAPIISPVPIVETTTTNNIKQIILGPIATSIALSFLVATGAVYGVLGKIAWDKWQQRRNSSSTIPQPAKGEIPPPIAILSETKPSIVASGINKTNTSLNPGSVVTKTEDEMRHPSR